MVVSPKSSGGIGFRDFKSFNRALLAKQAWRLLKDPSSLWASILKARYFPNVYFLSAKKGHRASWFSCSILEGRDLLERSLVWRIGSGNEVNIWGSKWVRSLHGFQFFLLNFLMWISLK